MAEQRQDKGALISETRRRFQEEYLPDPSESEKASEIIEANL